MRRQAWIKVGLLYIPPGQTKALNDLYNLAPYLSYSEIQGEKVSLEQIIAHLRKFKLVNCIELFSKIGMVLENDGDQMFKLQEMLKAQLISHETRVRINTKNRFYFFQQQLLTMMKLILLHNTNRPRRRLVDDKDIRAVATCALMLSDHFSNQSDLDTLAEAEWKELIIKFFVKTLYFHSSEQFGNLLARYYYLFFKAPEVKELRNSKDYVPISKRFKEITSFDLQLYFALGFAIATQFHDVSLLKETASQDKIFISKANYFSQTRIKPVQARRILAQLSDNARAFRERLSVERQNPERLYTDFLVFRQKPLLRATKDAYIPLNLQFLKEKITAGIYWTILDALNKAGGDGFAAFFGQIFEYYVRQLFKRMFPESSFLAKQLFFERKYTLKGSEAKTSDVMVFYGNEAIFIEVKAYRLHYKTGMSGDIGAFDEDIKKIVINPAKQIDRTIRDFQSRKFTLEGIDAELARELQMPTIEDVVDKLVKEHFDIEEGIKVYCLGQSQSSERDLAD